MTEVDYQTALLLQHQFEQELKSPPSVSSSNNNKGDFEFARLLQHQYEQESSSSNTNKPTSSSTTTNDDNKDCLVDPTWEVIDPTPDIHNLFVVFAARFFWDKLHTVSVSWSKRMTSCAGICTYRGRGGMCTITLSEPLLKLRPRKDLVQTLLHEMIHAYLFVTHNNRDRDGHGPEFCKHMARINAAAGTKITIYHSFHAEVRLYQQHWWRCNGPCQTRRPYFGMVRRAMNRAPGPSDRWWNEHSAFCGGKFIKVKEPEKVAKKSTKTTKAATSAAASAGVMNKFVTKINNNNNNNSSITKDNTSQKGGVIKGAPNIHGFSNNLTNNNNMNKRGSTSVKTNSSNTIVITKRPNNTITTTNESSSSSSSSLSLVSTSTGGGGGGVKLGNDTKQQQEQISTDYSAVRNHWLNKFSATNNIIINNNKSLSSPLKDNNKKRPLLDVLEKNAKVVKLSDSHCPICNKTIPINQLNNHLDSCLIASQQQQKECIICGRQVSANDFEQHVIKCVDDNFNNDDDDFVAAVNDDKNDQSVINIPDKKICPICNEILDSVGKTYDLHVEQCLLKMCDDIEEKYNDDNDDPEETTVSCLSCGKKILKRELNSHLEDCISEIFDDDDDDEIVMAGPSSASSNNNTSSSHYNCPLCLELVAEIEMKAHLDGCLRCVVDDDTNQKDLLQDDCF